MGFYYCISCDGVVFSHHAATGSTMQLLRHKCVQYREKELKIDNKHFDGLKKAAAKFICMDLRPFKAVECDGLQELVMAGVKLGKKYPKLSMADLKRSFPTRNTVKNMVTSEAHDAKESIKALFKQAIKNGGFGCTLDLWSDNYKHNSYLAMTANMYLVEGDQVIQKRIVFHLETIGEIVKSKEVIRQRIIDVFQDFDVNEEDIKRYVTFTTDR